jgi:hypothetical protein
MLPLFVGEPAEATEPPVAMAHGQPHRDEPSAAAPRRPDVDDAELANVADQARRAGGS